MQQPGEWWRGATIYQIYPRSFLDGNGDGIGDLDGIARRLDYVAGLGVDAIWISPFFASPMRDFGYDVSDYCAVDPIFGTLDGFDRLVARAHALGLKVMIDQVWSHTSDRHEWFIASRAARDGARADWYVWADPKPDGTPPNNWLSVFGGAAWTWEARRRQFYLHHFLASQPQLNWHNEAVVEAILATGAFWLERGVDGFRLDAIEFLLHDRLLRDNPGRPPPDGAIPADPFRLQHHRHDMLQPELPELLRRIRNLTARYPGTATLGELSSEDGAFERIGRYTSGGDLLHMCYTLATMRGTLDPPTLRQLFADARASGPEGWIAWAFSNHDVVRVASRWAPTGPDGRQSGPADPDLVRLLMALLLSLRGSVCIYQGEELGLPESEVPFERLQDPFGIAYYPEYRGRDGSRTPMPWLADTLHAGFTTGTPWLPVEPAHVALSVDRQEADPNSALHAWRRFLVWRKAQPALLGGSFEPVAAPEPLIAFSRRTPTQRLLVVLNLSAESVLLPQELVAGTRPLDGHGLAMPQRGERTSLPRYGVLFAEAATAATAD